MDNKKYFFIDESGTPDFYAKRKRPLWTEPNFEPILMMGMVVTSDRRKLRAQVLDFQKKILADPLFNSIYSVSQPNWFLHASNDHVDVRLKFIEFLRELEDIKCHIVIGRKIPEIFHSKHNGKETEFYFDLLNKMLAHYDFEPIGEYSLYLSQKQSSTVEQFKKALEKALSKQSALAADSVFNCSIVMSKDYPELSVVDYFMWALKRYITQKDKRYFAALESNFAEIYDIYEYDGKGRIYNGSDGFDLSKITPFGIK
jgi:hypothetical protein